MKIELKNIYYSERMSQETNCFSANLYINGKFSAEVGDEGHGGGTCVMNGSDNNDELITKAEAYCKTLPDVDGYPMDLEHYIDNLFENWLKTKAQKKLEKHMIGGICYGNENSYSIMTFKRGGKKVTINDLLQSESGRILLKDTIRNLREENHIIMNTNIPMDILEQSCITETII